MGTICAWAYTVIFMTEFEEKYINLLDKNISMLYLQYIGDIFMLWKSNYGI